MDYDPALLYTQLIQRGGPHALFLWDAHAPEWVGLPTREDPELALQGKRVSTFAPATSLIETFC